MITRRQWVGSARVLQVLNLIGPEGPIAPGAGTPGRNPRDDEPREGTQGRNLRKETLGRAGSIRPTGPTAPQPHSTTGPIATVHSVLAASIPSHHPSHCPSPFNFHIKHSKHKRKTMRK